MKTRLPIPVSSIDMAFGVKGKEILPPLSEIPEEFKLGQSHWCAWQSKWVSRGLSELPHPKEGIDGNLAIANLACVQVSFEPKPEHKKAGVAYLASLWFKETK